jgi:hypothetical protein
MAKTIVLLEDDERRVAAMTAWLGDRFPAYTVRTWANSQALCQSLEDIWQDVVLISLDHDLAVETEDGRFVDQGSGQEVADYLARREPAFPVILHSSNGEAVVRMDQVLRQRGWQTTRVLPVNDLAWVASAWWPAVRQLLVSAAGKDLRLRPVGKFPFRVSKLVRRLASLAPVEEHLLRRWLRYVLVKMPRLIAYVNWLRAQVGTFRHLELPARERADAVVAGGLQALGRDDLTRLALNPIALFHFHDRVREEKPAAWRSVPAARSQPAPILAAMLTILLLRVGRAHRVFPTGQDVSGHEVFDSELTLEWSGQTYRGKLHWNWKREGERDECYLRVELEGLRDTALAAPLKAPTLIVRSPTLSGHEGSGRAWREEVPLTWDNERGALVSAWRLVRTTPHDSVELELSLGPSSSAQAARRTHEDWPQSRASCLPDRR